MTEVVAVEESFPVAKWWVQLIRGLIILLFGMVALFWPLATLESLIWIFAIFAIIFGIFVFIASFFSGKDRWWGLLLEGLLGIAIGIIVLAWPGATLLVFLVILGIWAILNGLLELVMSYKLRKVIPDDWLLVLSGIISIIFGVMIFFWTVASVLVLVWFIAFYAIFFGVILIVLSMRLKQLQKKA
jgi:uncharacterized membrane protein HdeD (DUF308 family)